MDTGEYMSKIPIAPPSESSVRKRARFYEPLEGSIEGSTDSDPDDDESGGVTSGDSADTPVVEPG